MRINLPAGLQPELLAFLAAILLLVAPRPVFADDSALDFSVRVEIASHQGEPVVSRAWVESQLEAANRIFAPTHISFTASEISAGDFAAQLVTRGDRHRLGPRVDLRRKEIHVFVVHSMDDVDVPGRPLRGVHWRSRRGGAPRHFVVLTSIAGPNVLAHELGHFFGNPHSPTPGNIMSYSRGDVPPFFDPGQQRRIRRFAARFVRDGELRPRD